MEYLFVFIIAGAEKILPCPEMTTEGALWFSNLTIADPTLILPFAVGIFNLLNIEVSIFARNIILPRALIMPIITHTCRAVLNQVS